MEILIQSLVISLASVGLRIITSAGMIGYPIRKPFENLTGWRQYVMKPFILCVTCFASVWSVVISFFYYELNKETILIIFIAASLNSIIYALYEMISRAWKQ